MGAADVVPGCLWRHQLLLYRVIYEDLLPGINNVNIAL